MASFYNLGDVREVKTLTNVALGYTNPAYISDRLATIVPVDKQSDKYRVYQPENWVMEPGDDIRVPGTEANEIPGYSLSRDTYYAQDHSLQAAVTDEERQEAEDVTPYKDATESVTDKILLGRELSLRNMALDITNYAAGHSTTLAGANQWTDPTSDPLGVVQAAHQAIHAKLFIQPNTLMVPYRVMWALKEHPQFIEKVKYSQLGVITPALLSQFFEVPNIVVSEAGYNTANRGQAASVSYLWDTDVVAAYVAPRMTKNEPTFISEFNWKHPNGKIMLTDAWREDNRKSDVVRTSRRYDHKFASIDGTGKSIAGYLIKDAIA